MNVRVDIPDDVILRRHGMQSPFFATEDRVIPVVRKLSEDNRPEINIHAVRNLNKKGLIYPFRKEFQSRIITEFRCFYSGSRLYLSTHKLLDFKFGWFVPWGLTREHVAAHRNNDTNLVISSGNIVPCSKILNKGLGHVPLAVKLYVRDRLREFNFDRDIMSLETANQVWNEVIRIENPFWFEGNYPWYSHVYVGMSCEEPILEFRNILQKYEDDFLSMSCQDQHTLLYRPLEMDLMGIAKRVLGI